MTGSKPTIIPLGELAPEQRGDFFALLSQRIKATTHTGKPYYQCHFRDAKRTATCMIWGDSDRFTECENDWQAGQFFKLRATFGVHAKYGPQIEIHNIRPIRDSDRSDGFRESDYVERSRFDSSALFTELRGLVEASVQDEALRNLVLALLDRHQAALLLLPASPRHYFPFPGGWLEHTLSVVKNCLWLVERYRPYYDELVPTLNRDLVLAAATLHELGRVAELKPGQEVTDPVEFTVPGRLFGHLMLGRDLVLEAAREIPTLSPTLLQLLEHLLMSYLTIPEWGSPRLPMIPEALILHHADDLDAKLEMYARCLRKDTAAGPFTDRDPILGKPLLKERDI